MSEWSWVAFGYSVVYGSLALYVGWTVARAHRVRRLLRELR